MMVYAHNNTKIIVEQTPLEVSVSPGLKKSNISLDQSFIEFEEYPDTFLDSLLNFEGWVEDHQNPSIPQVMNSEEKPSLVNSLEIKKEEVCETAKLGDLIQEGIGRVSLTSGVDDVIDGLGSSEVTGSQETETPNNVDDNGVKNDGEKVGGDLEESKDSDSDSDSEEDDSSSSSSSSDDDDDDDEEEEEDDDDDDDDSDDEEESLKDVKKVKSEVEMEEGEIRDFEVEDDDDDDDDDVKGPIRSKNEVQNLPPVPPVTVTIEPHHKTLPVGVILSIMGPQVIVEGVENHNPLSEGSILCITETRLPLGVVDEIFGPVKNPYYMVRYNSETDIPIGVQLGSQISFVPEFADYVLNNNNLYKKGYDIHDEELSDELEFSDDEKEVEYKKMNKLAKRGLSEQKNGNTKKDNKSRNRGGGQRNNIDHRQASPGGGGGGPPGFSPGPLANFNGPPTGIWQNGFPSMPPQNMGFFPNGQFMQPNFTQQPFQILGMPNMGSFHPQFNNTGPMFQPNFGPNPAFGSWPMGMGQNNFNQPQIGPGQSNFNQPQGGPPMGFPGPFMNNGGGGQQGVVMGNGVQMENNGGVRPPFVAGNGETGQNRGGRRMFQRGGGRFRGGGRGGRSGMQSR